MLLSLLRICCGAIVGTAILLLGCLLLLLLPAPAQAQAGGGPPDNPCAVPAPTVPVYYTDLTPGRPFACMPAPGGPGKGLTVRYNSSGVTSYWYCPDNVDKPSKYSLSFGAATWARMAQGNLTPDTPMADPSLSVVWCPFASEMRANVPVVAPVATWRTNAVTVFNVVGTTLAGVVGSVPVGTACDCTKPVKIGSATYCTFAGAAKPAYMASCKASP